MGPATGLIRHLKEYLLICAQGRKTIEEKVGRLLDIIGRRSNEHFKLFISALVNEEYDDLAKLLDQNLAKESIDERHKRRREYVDRQGTIRHYSSYQPTALRVFFIL